MGAKKLSKMKPMVENNLTTIFGSNMGTHFRLDDLSKIVDATILFSLCVAKKPDLFAFSIK